MRYFISALLTVWLSLACAQNYAEQVLALPPFTAITINAAENVYIHSGNTFCVKLSGDPAAIKLVHPTVNNHRLTINTEMPSYLAHEAPMVDITVPTLLELVTAGSGKITLRNIHSPAFTLMTTGTGTVRAEGDLHLTHLVHVGDGDIQMAWIDSPSLSVQAGGSGRIQLAGTVKFFRVVAQDDIQLNAQFLRVDDAFAKAQQNAMIKIVTSHHLQAFASGNSTIYYLKTPAKVQAITQEAGNILQLAYWN